MKQQYLKVEKNYQQTDIFKAKQAVLLGQLDGGDINLNMNNAFFKGGRTLFFTYYFYYINIIYCMYLPCVQNFKSIGALSEEIFKKEEDRIHHWQKKHPLQI